MSDRTQLIRSFGSPIGSRRVVLPLRPQRSPAESERAISATLPARLTQDERRKLVAAGIKAGKSNRALAKELGVSEKTIRSDVKYHLTPESDRPAPRQRKPPKERTPRLNPRHDSEKRITATLKVVTAWLPSRTKNFEEINYIVHEAGKLLYFKFYFQPGWRVSDTNRSASKMTIPQIIERTRPKDIEEDVTGSETSAKWLAALLAFCLPDEETLQDEVLRRINQWATSSKFVY